MLISVFRALLVLTAYTLAKIASMEENAPNSKMLASARQVGVEPCAMTLVLRELTAMTATASVDVGTKVSVTLSLASANVH